MSRGILQTDGGVEFGEPTLEKLNELLLKYQNKIAILVHTHHVQYKFSMVDPRHSDQTDIMLGVVSGSIAPRNENGPYQFPFSDRYIRLQDAGEHIEDISIADGTNPFLYQSEFRNFIAAMAIRMETWKPSEQLRLYHERQYDFVVGEQAIKDWFKNNVGLWMSHLDIRLFKATTILGQPIKVASPSFDIKLQKRQKELTEQYNKLVREGGKTTDQLNLLKIEMSAFGIH